MGNKTLQTSIFAMCFFVGASFGSSVSDDPKTASLCSLQKKVSQGDHEFVRVSGVYGPSLDDTVLSDSACPSEGTWIELALRSEQNKDKLRKLLEHSRAAAVVIEGEFYGPPLPDPKLPEAVKKNYQPGWGHLAAFRTKLIVYTIRDVRAAP